MSGTWPSDTYSAKRRADSSSSAQASSASNARPAGSGRRVPRWNHAGNAGAIERMLEHAEIGLRRAQQDRHLVERHSAIRLLQQAPGDLDRFAAFTGSGEQHHRIVGRARRWRVDREQMSLEPLQRGVAIGCRVAAVDRQIVDRSPIAGRNSDDNGLRGGDHGFDERRLPPAN